ncbi:MAG: GntR family transcriptional regulator [bacterium]|nr:GntR family transcriptional regulator [bacterium]
MTPTHQVTPLGKNAVFETLVDEILTNRIPAGAALTERALVGRFGLSRTPIREVLLRLQAEHLVDFYPNQGAFVRKLTPHDIRDLFEMREALEPLAAALAARHRPEAELEQLTAEFGRVDETTDAATLTRLGERLHDAIAAWSGNQLLEDFSTHLRRQMMLVRAMLRSQTDLERRSLQEHLELLRALHDRDPDAARAQMTAHLERSHTAVMALILAR